MNMSREIKFRVWDKDNNKMLHYDNDIVPCLTLNGVLQDCSKEVSSNVSYKYELMQFTGLLDKNGKEIYEGDILDYESYNKYEVYFMNGKFMACNELGYDINNYYYNKVKVIGNIYQNKNLIN